MASQGGEGSSDSKMDHGEWKIFNDSVHGNMEFHPLCVAIIDTPEFQRLRYLKQLGVCYFVYPGASHNRFEHCLGVCYLAGLLVKRLKTSQPELGITKKDVLCVKIAGLCHDLGHGPFSHLFDKKFIPKSENWTHEKASKELFDHMVKDEKLKQCFEDYKIGDGLREFIKELICGKPEDGETKFYKPKTKKAFLYEIVANKRNEVDVDKMDYFKRDALHLGMTSGFDHMRFINFAKVIEVDGEWQICIRDKEVFNMYEMFHTRYALHRRAYQHKTVQAVEIMLLEAMKEADGKLGLSTSIDDMDAYINRTDSVFHEILMSTDPGLKKAREYLQNINKRKLHKCVGETCPNPDFKMKDNDTIRREILENVRVEDKPKLESFDFAVQTVKLDFGGGEENPLMKLRFYTKDDTNNAVVCKPSQVSSMIPQVHFKEHLVRVFLFPTENNKERLELLHSGFEKWCEKNGLEPKFPISSSTSTATKAPDRDSKRGGDPAGPAGSSSKVPRQVNP